jgi:hypothetical protein
MWKKNICGERAWRWLVEAFTNFGADGEARPGATPRPMTARRLNRPLGRAVVHHSQCPRLARERWLQIDPQQPVAIFWPTDPYTFVSRRLLNSSRQAEFGVSDHCRIIYRRRGKT